MLLSKMDNLSYYGTLGAILLIQISFAWLYRQDDGFNRSLSREQVVKNRLTVVLVNYNHRFGRALKDRLEAVGFSTYAISFTQEHVSNVSTAASDKTNGKIFSLDAQNTTLGEIQRVVEAIERDSSENRGKLQAFIDFRPSCSGNPDATGRPSDLPPSEMVHRLDRLKEIVFRQISLSVLLSQRIKDDKAKMIVVRDRSDDSIASPDPYSSTWAQSIDSLADRYSRNIQKPLVVQQISTLLLDYLSLIDNNCLSIDQNPEELGDTAEKSASEQQNTFVDKIVQAILRL